MIREGCFYVENSQMWVFVWWVVVGHTLESDGLCSSTWDRGGMGLFVSGKWQSFVAVRFCSLPPHPLLFSFKFKLSQPWKTACSVLSHLFPLLKVLRCNLLPRIHPLQVEYYNLFNIWSWIRTLGGRIYIERGGKRTANLANPFTFNFWIGLKW